MTDTRIRGLRLIVFMTKHKKAFILLRSHWYEGQKGFTPGELNEMFAGPDWGRVNWVEVREAYDNGWNPEDE